MKKALIFGTDGFVGRYMAEELFENGYEVYGTGRHGGQQGFDYEGWYVCDLTDSDNVKNIIAEVNPTHIVNLAAQSNVGISWKIPKRTLDANVCGPINILEAINQCEADCSILMIGSSEEYDNCDHALNEKDLLKASNPYGISKVTLECLCELYRKRYGMKIHFVRSFNHTGIGQTDNFVIPSWCKQVADITNSGHAGEMHVGNLEIKRDFSNVKDIVSAYRLILESDEFDIVYNVGSGKGESLRDILSYIISLSDQEIKVEIDKKLIRPVENPVIYCDNTLLREKLGWRPRYDIYTTAKEIYEYYLNERKQT